MDIRQLLPTFIVIPSVPFRMGTPEAELSGLAKQYGGTRESYREESPQHTLTLPAFAIARVPVTNALYAAYVAATGASPPLHWHGPHPPAGHDDHPVVNVSWHEAQGLCEWLNSNADCRLQIADFL
ncbi:MAG: formylglycine-generating enzyme family protein, partial [Chloroflexaceae bacterium]|nr:formylglycine-generating enzyme family protein [Chloroflexaceae bacterium]